MKTNLRIKWLLLVPAMFAAFALVAVGCGGDDDGGTGSDEDYVKAVCKAGNKLEQSLENAQEEADELATDPDNAVEAIEKALELFAEPFSEFAKDLDKANPPADVKENHDRLVAAIKDIADLVEEGDLGALDELGNTLGSFQPAQAIQDRLSAAAEGVSECDDGSFFS